jgi:hypothetical protein
MRTSPRRCVLVIVELPYNGGDRPSADQQLPRGKCGSDGALLYITQLDAIRFFGYPQARQGNLQAFRLCHQLVKGGVCLDRGCGGQCTMQEHGAVEYVSTCDLH